MNNMINNIYLLNILIPVIFGLIINVYMYINYEKNDDEKNTYLPPGYIIGIIWMIILGLLGYTHYLTYYSTASIFVFFVILYCLLYPFLTTGLKMEQTKIYNAIAFIFAITLFIIIYVNKYIYSILILPLLLWSTYVFIVTNLII